MLKNRRFRVFVVFQILSMYFKILSHDCTMTVRKAKRETKSFENKVFKHIENITNKTRGANLVDKKLSTIFCLFASFISKKVI